MMKKKQVTKMKPLHRPKNEKPMQMIWNDGKQQGSQLMKYPNKLLRENEATPKKSEYV